MVFSSAICILITWKKPGRINNAPSEKQVLLETVWIVESCSWQPSLPVEHSPALLGADSQKP